MDRLNFPNYACQLAVAASARSEDPHTQVGCVILDKDRRVLSVGYNGLPPKLNINPQWTREEKLFYFLHAEENALSLVSKSDKPFYAALTISPCLSCARNMVAHGIRVVYYLEEYHREQDFKKLFCYANIGYYNLKQ